MKHKITAERLSLALSNNNMKSQELADRSGVSKASISQYVNGSHAPSNLSSGKMGKVLGVNPLWLMGFDEPMIKQSEPPAAPSPTLIRVTEKITRLDEPDLDYVEGVVDTKLDSDKYKKEIITVTSAAS